MLSRERPLAGRGPRPAFGYAVALLGTLAVTAGLLQYRAQVSKINVVLAFLVIVIAAAANGGIGPGVLSAVLGFLAFDLLFIPPYNTLLASDKQNYLSFAAYLAIAFIVSMLVAGREQRRLDAERRERASRTLYELSTSLVAPGSLEDTLERVVKTVRGSFDLAGCAVELVDGSGSARIAAHDGKVPVLEHTPPDQALAFPLRAAGATLGSLVVFTGGPEAPPFGEAEQRLLATFANQAALAVQQGALAEERSRARELEETDQLRRALLNSVSHDLRTPLASIKASASSLLDEQVAWSEDERRDFLSIIDQESDRLTRLVHNLLDMSRIEAGALDPNLVITSLADVVGSVVRLARTRSPQPITVDVPETLPSVLADPVRLEQVLTNLVDNACRYAGAAAIEIIANARGDTVELRVRDHGPGIPEAERDRVFDQFYRLKGRARVAGSTGMGLAICRGIVEAIGGRLRVESTPAGGATMVVALPMAPTTMAR